jgi:2-isopropylmalate synthase
MPFPSCMAISSRPCANAFPTDKAIWSVHCHNDLGMAVANSLAGVKIGGARQVECTINGLGERAGNCSLEEVVMAVKTRRDYFGLDIGIDTQHILAASRMVSQTTGFVVQPNKAVVGANAFAHASGIHQDGVLKARDTYEIMRAEDVGWSANKIVLGKLSGRNAFKQRLQELGVSLDSESEINTAFARFKELADRKSEIFDEDILALVSDESVTSEKEQFGFVSLSQHSETGNGLMPPLFSRSTAARSEANRTATGRWMRPSKPLKPM